MPRARSLPVLGAVVLAALVGAPRPARAAPAAPLLRPGTALAVRLERGRKRWVGDLDVPAGTRRLHVLTASRQNVDVGASRTAAPDALADLPNRRLGPTGEERLTVERPEAGRWHVTVEHPASARGGATFEVCAVLEGEDGPVLLSPGESACTPGSAERATSAVAWLPLDAVAWTLETGAARVRAVDRLGARTLPTGRDHPHAVRVPGLLRLDPLVPAAGGTRFDVRVPDAGEPPPLQPAVETEIELGGGQHPNGADFRIVVPEGVPRLEIACTADRGADFDLYARLGAPAAGDDDHDDAWSMTTGEEDRLVLGGARGVEPGTWYLRVSTTDEDKAAGATLLLRARTAARPVGWAAGAPPPLLVPGTWTPGVVRSPRDGTTWFRAEVPAGARRLSVQVVEATSDVDLLLADGAYGRVRARAVTERIDEGLDVDLTGLRLPAGLPVALGVANPLSGEPEVRFRLGLAFDRRPALPADLAMPPYPVPPTASAVERAAMAVVEVAGTDGEGSGTCLSPGGLILTARHILEVGDAPGAPLQTEGVLIAFPYDRARPPRQTHVARVVEEDAEADLALLQITEDVYGRPVPAEPRFAFLPAGPPPPVSLGDPLLVLGYPGAGSERSRTPIIVVRGALSGVETPLTGPPWLKTDAHISPGHSGGPVLDAQGRFVGVADATLGKYDQLGLIRPLSSVPEAWWARIRGAAGSPEPRSPDRRKPSGAR